MNSINWSSKSKKQLNKIPAKDAEKIYLAIGKLITFPNCFGDIKQLQGKNEKRLRVGNYRVIFNFYNEVEIIAIEEIKKRDERTY